MANESDMQSVPAKLTKRIVDEMDELIKQGWYANKSELIRCAIRDLIKKQKVTQLESAIKAIFNGVYMENKAVSNTGPIIHLSEINLVSILDIFSSIVIPKEVEKELNNSKIIIPRKIKTLELSPEFKDKVKVLTNQENLDLGEAFAIVLAMQEKADYFLTDDLDARNVSIKYNILTHGTIGIVLRAFREKIIDKKTAIEKVNELYTQSSLFITKDLVSQVITSINEFND